MLVRSGLGASLLAVSLTSASPAQDGIVQFVDVGPGLCVIAEFPGDQQMLFDAGHRADACFDAVVEVMGTDDTIELVVISHPDYDHYADLRDILGQFEVTTLIETGYPRPATTSTGRPSRWAQAREAIDIAASGGTRLIRLTDTELARGTAFPLGDATATFVAGWPEWPADLSLPDGPPSGGQAHNVISIVMRLEYAGTRVLLTGDSSGRRRAESEPDHVCRDAQLFMVNHAATISLDADVMTSAHHGARNGDARCFINAVSPDAVVISAGGGSPRSDYRHPQASAVQYYLDAGVPADQVFRTDRGDGPAPGSDPDAFDVEWDYGSIPSCIDSDRPGDDTVELRIFDTATPSYDIGYRTPSADC